MLKIWYTWILLSPLHEHLSYLQSFATLNNNMMNIILQISF
jgi:hypothetical protein